jgi:ATP-dependent helicase HepA
MPVFEFSPGQRWVSDTEPGLGLGTLLKQEGRTVTLLFPASGERRTYALDNSPLTRVRFAAGDPIQDMEGRPLWVVTTEESEGLIGYRVRDENGVEETLPEGGLSSFLQFSRPQERLFAGQLDQPHWFGLRLQTLQLRQRLEQSPLLGLGGARTTLLPHQLYIAHEVSRRPAPRVLLADEVGLGKTIEACLILHRQLLTGRASRALIIVPSPLLNQWLVELLRRFNLRFSLYDEARCQAIEASDQSDNPFVAEQLVLTSLALFTERPERAVQALQAGWDLLIVDEAHHLEWSEGQASDAYRVVEVLARRIPGVLLLTATPEQLGRAGHFARLRLLDPDRFHSLEAFQQEEAMFEPVAAAVTQLLSGEPLPTESARALLETLGESEALTLLQRCDDPKLAEPERAAAREQLIDQLLDRHGTGRVLFRSTRHRIKGFPSREHHAYPLPLPEEYQRCLDDPAAPIEGRLRPEALYRCTVGRPWWRFDPRVEWLINRLRQLRGEKMLLICALADSARELAQALRVREGIDAALFHEGLTILERDRAAAWFADPEEGCQLLICSEIGSEGRNFQFAHHLVLFDLPLDPDLLEQRIGRLDRIGQQQTIRIHTPCFEESAQAVMLAWYRDGLDAFEQSCPAGHAIFSRLRPALLQAIEEPWERQALTLLVETTRQLHQESSETLRRGRDQLLELNSCREPAAARLQQAIEAEEQASTLPGYLEALLTAWGVESEEHSAGSLILRPGARMLSDTLPGLPAEGLTATFDRRIALQHEERQFLTWEHPLVRESMAMLTDSGQGRSVATAIRHPRLKGGSLLLELLLVVECPAPRRLQAGRFLPPTMLRLLLDQDLRNLGEALPHDALNPSLVPLDPGVARRIIEPLRPRIKAMLAQGERLAEQQRPGLVDTALEQMSQSYESEIERLTALQRVNPNVRQEEIDALRQQATELARHIESARLKLDAVRLIVAL